MPSTPKRVSIFFDQYPPLNYTIQWSILISCNLWFLVSAIQFCFSFVLFFFFFCTECTVTAFLFLSASLLFLLFCTNKFHFFSTFIFSTLKFKFHIFHLTVCSKQFILCSQWSFFLSIDFIYVNLFYELSIY